MSRNLLFIFIASYFTLITSHPNPHRKPVTSLISQSHTALAAEAMATAHPWQIPLDDAHDDALDLSGQRIQQHSFSPTTTMATRTRANAFSTNNTHAESHLLTSAESSDQTEPDPRRYTSPTTTAPVTSFSVIRIDALGSLTTQTLTLTLEPDPTSAVTEADALAEV